MLNLLYPLIRPLAFAIDAENAHDLTLKWLSGINKSIFRVFIAEQIVEDPVEVFGITFPNRLGLAAGLDKNGAFIDTLASLGFGHIEIGTVTPRAQPGNEKPRLFRLPKAKALINRFGFNNHGVDQLVENVKSAKYSGVLGINIGKNFDTPVEQATEDYLICLDKVYQYASYVTVNISSPNTANLRQLQFGKALDELIDAIKKRQTELAEKHSKRVPVLIKIAPDLDDQEINELADTLLKHNVDGVIATNTTFSRRGVEGLAYSDEQGGLSGAPLFDKSTDVLTKLANRIDGAFPIIAVGGIDSGQKASKKIEAGASLVQIYSGFIYEGPGLISEIAKALKRFALINQK